MSDEKQTVYGFEFTNTDGIYKYAAIDGNGDTCVYTGKPSPLYGEDTWIVGYNDHSKMVGRYEASFEWSLSLIELTSTEVNHG